MTNINISLVKSLRITDKSNVPDMEPVILINGEAILATKGDISVVGGKEKAGKTSVSMFMVATALMPDDLPAKASLDSLGIRSTYCNGKPVVFIDTEQSPSSIKRFYQNIAKIVGDRAYLENMHVYNLRPLYKASDKKEALELIFEMHPDAHLIIIDGIADIVSDPNLPEPSNELIAQLMSKAEELHTSIVAFIHENPGQSTKFRGNLGSELQRKCYGAIGIKKDKQKRVHCIEARLLRHSGDFDDIYFRYDKELGRMVSLTGQESEDYRSDSSGERRKRELRYRLAHQCLVGGSERIRHNEFIRRILNHALLIEGKTFSDTTAKSRLKDMLELGIVEKTAGDRYRLIPTDQSSKTEKSQ